MDKKNKEEEEERPCCPSSAARMIRKVMIGGKEVGIAQLDQIISKISKMSLTDENELSSVLIKEVKIYNYVPRSKENEYRKAVMEEYRKRTHGPQR
ncbi:MAG: hypothetical protein HPY73_03445 [Methanomassiliicoccales archaeon]|nr:MAG: hypothetical protein HPY73_03445 [Methanomassiliicoccales archaeon]